MIAGVGLELGFIVGVGVSLGLFRRVFCHGMIGFGLVIIFRSFKFKKSGLQQSFLASPKILLAMTMPKN